MVIQPARDMRDASRFALMFGERPYVDGENGPLFRGGGYGSDFSSDDDTETFHNQQWANVSSGAANSGIRHPQGVLESNSSLLLPEMDDIQGTIAQFFNNEAFVDLNNFDVIAIDSSISISNSDNDVVKIGIKDSTNKEAIVFLLVDKAHISDGVVGNVDVSISGMSSNETYRVEDWDTHGFNTSPRRTLQIVTDDSGVITFEQDLQTSAAYKITFWQPEASSASDLPGDMGISVMIKTEEKGPVEGSWMEGGRNKTERGDVVVWGHCYAPLDAVSWGDPNNPELFVKVWYDVSGRIDVNYFHVSVPDIDTYSAFNSPLVWTSSGRTTMDNRYMRHEYWSTPPSITNSSSSGGERNENGYDITDDLFIQGTFYPSTAEAFPTAWREIGRGTTLRGDQVVWGFFYAAPEDRTWGNMDNPDVYVKIWYDISGRIDVNFFHVSVPDISVTSGFRSEDHTNTITMDDRYTRDEYWQ